MFSQSENQSTFQCVRTTFGHQRLPFSTKQDLANGWKKLFLETKKTTQQWAMTRSLFANIAFSSNSNQSFVCVRYSIGEIFYSSKCTYLPCWGAVLGSSWWVMTPSSKSCPPLWIWRAWHITEWLNTQQSEFTKMWTFFFKLIFCTKSTRYKTDRQDLNCQADEEFVKCFTTARFPF